MGERESYDAEGVNTFLKMLAEVLFKIEEIKPDKPTFLITLDELIAKEVGGPGILSLLPRTDVAAMDISQIRGMLAKQLETILDRDSQTNSADPSSQDK